jgi:hypothetical protein
MKRILILTVFMLAITMLACNHEPDPTGPAPLPPSPATAFGACLVLSPLPYGPDPKLEDYVFEEERPKCTI